MPPPRIGVEEPRTPGVGNSAARVLVASLRHLNSHAAWCSNYEFEDVIAEVDDAEILVLERGRHFELRHRASRSLAWRAPHPAFMQLNPGVRAVTLQREYDLFFFACMNPWDLLYLNAIRGWKERCRIKVCFLVEFYSAWARDFELFLRLLGGFDHVALSFSGSVDAVGQVAGVPTCHVPLATDVRRFSPFPRLPPRVIDVFSVGRRSEPLHETLLEIARSQGIYYVHDTLPSATVHPSKPSEHRTMYASSAKRSRLFIAFPAKFGDAEKQGQSEVGARYFEGTAAGAVLIGQPPTVPAFRDHFPWPDALVAVRDDGSDARAVIGRVLAEAAEFERRGLRNAREALRRHDWGHRWQSILRLTGMPPRPALGERLRDLNSLAGREADVEGAQ